MAVLQLFKIVGTESSKFLLMLLWTELPVVPVILGPIFHDQIAMISG